MDALILPGSLLPFIVVISKASRPRVLFFAFAFFLFFLSLTAVLAVIPVVNIFAAVDAVSVFGNPLKNTALVVQNILLKNPATGIFPSGCLLLAVFTLPAAFVHIRQDKIYHVW